jgi:hypothetical protein
MKLSRLKGEQFKERNCHLECVDKVNQQFLKAPEEVSEQEIIKVVVSECKIHNEGECPFEIKEEY